jgi:predicted ATPase
VTVSFSAFDPQRPLQASADVDYTYIGLKQPTGGGTKNYTELAVEFERAVQDCLTGTAARRERWAAALATLEATDALFSDARIRDLAGDDYVRSSELPNLAVADLFDRLSSGHKIVLLTLACLVQNTVERTLVLVDEPEAHLHPPLLSALLRAMSDLMLDRNGLAVIATHSPVVLQETPRSAVWALRRVGDDVRVDHPEIETFGENVGVITREIFGLEVRRSGFHQLIQDLADEGRSYEEIVEAFRGNLGAEGHALARAAARHFRQQR